MLGSAPVDPARALSDLMEISTQIRAAAILDTDGSLIASTLSDEDAARRLAQAARALWDEAEKAGGAPGASLVQLEAAALAGSVLVVRGEAGRTVAAVTRPEPTAGLVFYDLKNCLRTLVAEEGDGRPRPVPASPAQAAEGAEGGAEGEDAA